MTSPPSLLDAQAAAVHQRIVDAAIAVIEAGREPTMRAIAKAAGISERTIYRYFPSHGDLQVAIMPAIGARASTPMAATVDQLPDYVRRLYETFDQNARLARELMRVAGIPTAVTRPENLRRLRAVIDAGFPRAPEGERASATANLRVLYSAAGWAYLVDCGFDLEDSIRHAQWLTTTVIDRLQRAEGGKHA